MGGARRPAGRAGWQREPRARQIVVVVDARTLVGALIEAASGGEQLVLAEMREGPRVDDVEALAEDVE